MAYCFISGYALMAQYEATSDKKQYMEGRFKSLKRFVLNYWVILMLFAAVAIILGKTTEWLISPKIFLGNVAIFWYSYNGAWWFVSTYIVMVLLSPFVFRILKKHPIIIAGLSVIIYTVSYLVRFKIGGMVQCFGIQHLARLGMSYAELLLGSYFYYYKVMDKVGTVWNRFVPSGIQKSMLVVIAFVTVIFRRYVPTLLIAPISGMVFILTYLLYIRSKDMKVADFFEFMGRHSTNVWLVHMFFYTTRYGGLVFKFKYSVFVLAALIIFSLITSEIVNRVHKGLNNYLIVEK